jgi:NAD-dependent deacetylase
MKKVVVLTGAGMSAESGIKTFRDAGGLWEGHDIMEVASPQGFENNPDLVLDFYNQRRRQLLEVSPNQAHYKIAQLEKRFNITVITQNIDDLHERAGSTKVVHLHGELLKARSTKNEGHIYNWEKDIVVGDHCELNSQLRPHIVWFGEPVPKLDHAIEITLQADILIIIGTSMQVYPAASLVHYIKPNTPMFFIDPNPTIQPNDFNNLTVIAEIASKGVNILIKEYLNG